MISKVLNHALQATDIWLIANKLIVKHRKHHLNITPQVNITIGGDMEVVQMVEIVEVEETKKKKNKKRKGKNRKVEWEKESDKSIIQRKEQEWRVQKCQNLQNAIANEYEKEQRRKVVVEELELIQNYFLNELEQIRPYNGTYGHYKLSIEGTTKAITLQWTYTQDYPSQIVDIGYSQQGLNLLQIQKITDLFSQHSLNSQKHPNYPYIFNLSTSIYQDCMLIIKQLGQQDKTPIESVQYEKKELIKDNKDMQAMKQIYDQIFYLHDMVEKPDMSVMLKPHEELGKVGQTNNRGRYTSEFEQIELIGEGGFGKVYKVRHKFDGNIYAIKKAVVNYQDLNDRKVLKQVSLLSKLNHPNIVRYYQSWLQDSNSMNEIIQDMDYTEDQDKQNQLGSIYKRWKHDRSGGIVFQSGSEGSYVGSVIDDGGIIFQDNNSDIQFEDDGQDMSTPDRSSISQNSQSGRPSSQSSSMMNGMVGQFPFKILYIAMQLCSGINLRQYINTRFNDEQQKIQILRGILQGLAYIHQKKIIHRDLKPANIFLTENSKVKIGDFGLAITQEKSVNYSIQNNHQFDPFSDKTKAVGTGFYRAPQQLKTHKYNQKADIYSLGIIMFQLFYQFRTAMQRQEVLKQLTYTQMLPKDFIAERKGTDILQSVTLSLKDNPEERPSAAKLLENFRNKYFTQLLSYIANPKHFQFSELITHLFQIKNQAVTPLLWRDFFKSYLTNKLQRIYHIHRASFFPTLPLLPVQDYQTLNNHRIKTSRSQKYLLLSNRGVVLEYTSNCLKSWLKYAKEDFRRKKQMSIEEQRSSIRRYTFQKVVDWRAPVKSQELCFHQKMVTAFDLAYKIDQGFNPFFLFQVLKISEAIINTLAFTQRKPPLYLFHSQLYSLISQSYQINKSLFYSALLSIQDHEQFTSWSLPQKILYFEQKNIPGNVSRKISELMDKQFQDWKIMFDKLEINKDSEIFRNIQFEMEELQKVRQRLDSKEMKGINIRWKALIPQSSCSGFMWEIATLRGLTTVQQYSNNQEFCNYHIQMPLDPQKQLSDLSIWCIGEYLQPQMQKIIAQCWKHGLRTRWYDWQIGQTQDSSSRHSIILKRKNDKVQLMVKQKLKKGQHHQQRQSSFFNLQQFKFQQIKQSAVIYHSQSYH